MLPLNYMPKLGFVSFNFICNSEKVSHFKNQPLRLLFISTCYLFPFLLNSAAC